MISILLVENHWRFKFQNIRIDPISTDKDISLSHHGDDLFRSFSILNSRLFVFNNVDSLKEPKAPNISNKTVFFTKLLYLFSKVVACGFSIFLKFFIFHHIQNTACSSHGHWVTAKSTKKLNIFISIAFRNLFCAHHC